MIDDTLVGSQFDYRSGVDGSVTVPDGWAVDIVVCHASVGGATWTISPGGPGQSAPPTAGTAIPIPAVGWFGLELKTRLGSGTVFVFVGTDSYLVTLARMAR